MTDINLQTLTPDTTLPTTGFLFGADSQASGSPSVYTVQSVATTLLGSTTLTGATITADAPVLNLAQTWNAGGVTFTGLKLNATDTASAAGSLLLDIGTGGGTYASKFKVDKAGYSTSTSGFVAGVKVQIDIGQPGLSMASESAVAWSGTGNYFNNKDLLLVRDAANILAQRNGVNAQAFRLYNTYTDASNYERGAVAWSGNILTIGTAAAGTGTARAIQIGVGATGGLIQLNAANTVDIIAQGIGTLFSIAAAGSSLNTRLIFGTDNAFDIGASGATRPRDLFVGRNFTLSGTQGIQTTASSTTFLVLAAGVAGASQMRLVQGVAPSAPVDGDIWREDNTNTGLKIRVNGVTKTITLV